MSNLKSMSECMRQCKCREHGDAITSAITKRCVSDAALASYLRCTCANFTQVLDHEGRTALHMAVSRGRQSLVEWLLKMSSEPSVNARDRESGFTALHRSIFYGQIHIAVSLMKMGINADILDKDDYKAVEHAMLDQSKVRCYDSQQPCDVYVWGSNSNYTLGTGTQHQRNSPDILNCFSRQSASVKQVCLGKFHSVWLDTAGVAWGCGQAWRLGADDAVGTLLRPARLRLPEPCVRAALTLDTTVFLLQSGTVVQYGSSESENNTRNRNSGNSSKKCELVKLAVVKPLVRLSGAQGLCASRQHCVLWTDRDVLTWGVNVGQLGHSQPEHKTVNTPKKVLSIMNSQEGNLITFVAVCDAATAIATSRGDVYLLHKYLCKKIITKQINLKQIAVEGKIKEYGVSTNITVLLLTNVGDILMWQSQHNQLTRCVFGLSHSVTATHIALSNDSMLLTSKYGEGFVGHVTGQKAALVGAAKKGRSQGCELCVVALRRLPNVHRAVQLTADMEGHNFSALQVRPTWGLTSYPKTSASSMQEDMSVFLSEASTDDDLHDFVFEVGDRLFPAHAYLIASGSDYLYQLYQDASQRPGKPRVMVKGVQAVVFERVMQYLYTGSCDVLRPGPCGLRVTAEAADVHAADEFITEDVSQLSAFEVNIHDKDKDNDKKGRKARRSSVQPARCIDPVKLVRRAARLLQIHALDQLLTHYYCQDGHIYERDSAVCNKSAWALQRTQYMGLADVELQGAAGPALPTHKCVLAARLQYFRGMFMHSWSENKGKSVIKLPIKENILRPVVDFLYSDVCPELESSESIDFVSSLLIVADQLFVGRLREMCEVALAGLVTLKNCAEMLQFADTYNSPQLKRHCMEYISMNLCVFLENKNLECLSQNVLCDLTEFYCAFYPVMSSRVVTPFSCAANDDVIVTCADSFPVDLNTIDDEYVRENKITPLKKKNKPKRCEYTENEKSRMRYESVSSVNSLDIPTENVTGDITLTLQKLKVTEQKYEMEEKWIKVQSPQDKLQKIVQARLRVVGQAKGNLPESSVENFTTLTKSIRPDVPSQMVQTITSPVPQSPKDSEVEDHNKSPCGSIYINRVGSTKLSQKQRKKLTMERRDSGFDSGPSSGGFQDEAVSTSPKSKNPWKIVENSAVEATPEKETSVSLDVICAHQRKEKCNFSRMMSKPLLLTQLEDKAIEDLEKFYNINEIDEERISVYRIDRNIQCSPQWLRGNSRALFN